MIPRLHLILDLPLPDGRDPQGLAVEAVRGGAGAVHLRGRQLGAGALLGYARAVRVALDGRALLLVNDRLDVALAAAAAGVQLPSAGLPPAVSRTLAAQVTGQGEAQEPDTPPSTGMGRRSEDVSAGSARAVPFVVGCSVHNVTEARAATAAGADFLLLGTVFSSASHPDRAPGGEALVRAVRAVTRLPLIAIGGITPLTAARAIGAGADGVAAIRAIAAASDASAAAAALLREVERALAVRADPAAGTGNAHVG